MGGSLYETLGSRPEVPCLHFTLASRFKRNFELVLKFIPQPGKPTLVFWLSQVKFVQPFAITARRVTLHAFKKILQRSAQSLCKKLGRVLYVKKSRKSSVFHNFFAFFPKFHILHYFE